jgi:hypothetical protein
VAGQNTYVRALNTTTTSQGQILNAHPRWYSDNRGWRVGVTHVGLQNIPAAQATAQEGRDVMAAL